jgi:hypothetical protein
MTTEKLILVEIIPGSRPSPISIKKKKTKLIKSKSFRSL